ncbi:hypothetical protein [Demequina activiva]|uniref:Uncharacterized protein n=1 Tax=Demequina activiva TaxID=1582364 RepID=A0A919Q2R1_9MICO|nr:hypothetical protein [Demequina activiva]GIG53348.1 hypothetical protein Dac01nite_01000 [Demequina activiva]
MTSPFDESSPRDRALAEKRGASWGWQIEHHPDWRVDPAYLGEVTLRAASGAESTVHLCASRDQDGRRILEACVVIVNRDELEHIRTHPEELAAITEQCHFAWILAPMGFTGTAEDLPECWGLLTPERIGFLWEAVPAQLLNSPTP